MKFKRKQLRRADLLSRPRGGITLGVHYDPDAFGNFSEAIARLLGTARYLVIQTVICVVWVAYNAISSGHLRFDPYPFILLTLALSLQAAYAAPLILLAQNRQGDRERQQTERDRQLGERTQAEAEFMARELASVRLQLADIVSIDDLNRAVDRLASAMERQLQQMEQRQEQADQHNAEVSIGETRDAQNHGPDNHEDEPQGDADHPRN